MDISLITSLYRAERHLPTYSRHVRDTALHLGEKGLSVEIVIVANDASAVERRLIAELTEAARGAAVVPVYVDREPLYASWNRGVAASSGQVIGFWNVDDVRGAPALVEGFNRISAGCQLIDFPYTVLKQGKRFGLLPMEQRRLYPAPYDPAGTLETPRRGLSPFFLFARDLYTQAGAFDAHFRIAGDWEWSTRQAVRSAPSCHGENQGGVFILHGGNLSGTRRPLEQVEYNIVFMRLGIWQALKPAEPDLMRACWLEWGDQELSVPPDVQDRLWGERAAATWRQWQRQQRRQRISETLRLVPRFIINRTGIRPHLARLGIVKTTHSQVQNGRY